MNKKLIALLVTVSLVLSLASAQNFSMNDFQKAGLAYEKQANDAMTAGEYEKAAEFAGLASIEYAKSKEFAVNQGLKFRAANAITLAQNGIDRVTGSTNAKKFTKEVVAAKALLAEAKVLYTAEKWEESRSKAQESLAVINAISGTAATPAPVPAAVKPPVTLPRFYEVVERNSNRDCYWNIAKMPEVYGNPHLWARLYNANKAKMPDPENPDLILPGMVVEIPQLKNEIREGTYESGKSYPKLPD